MPQMLLKPLLLYFYPDMLWRKLLQILILLKMKYPCLGEKQNVYLTNSGHYAIPLNNSKLIHMNNSDEIKINLVAKKDMSKKKSAYKLHSQFGYFAKGKWINLIEIKLQAWEMIESL